MQSSISKSSLSSAVVEVLKDEAMTSVPVGRQQHGAPKMASTSEMYSGNRKSRRRAEALARRSKKR